MDGQMAIEEVQYLMELEKLLARFHQDLDRVRATAEACELPEVVEYLMRAQTSIGGACCAVAVALR